MSAIIHLSTRAVEWLRAAQDPVTYQTRIGTYACGDGRGNLTARVADVRALVHGKSEAEDYDENAKRFRRKIIKVTCSKCCVIQDAELQASKQVRP